MRDSHGPERFNLNPNESGVFVKLARTTLLVEWREVEKKIYVSKINKETKESRPPVSPSGGQVNVECAYVCRDFNCKGLPVTSSGPRHLDGI